MKKHKNKSKSRTQSLKEKRMTKYFRIIGVSRESLENYGYDTSKMDDKTMEWFASEMCDVWFIIMAHF